MRFIYLVSNILAAVIVLFSWPADGMQLCDYNRDWDVDGLDLKTFIDYYIVQDPAADVDDSGTIDGQDLSTCSLEFGVVVVDDEKPVVSISNLAENTAIKSGFIRGTASDDDMIAVVEVKLDNNAFAAATGTDHWSIKLPTGAASWRDGSRHSIEVRAIDRYGNSSDTLVLQFRKGTNKDINGDGYADLVAGASGTHDFGHVFVFNGSDSGVSMVADTTIIGEVQNSSFGDSLALGDINGDGYADLVIGNYGYDSSLGRVWIFHGSPDGIADADLSAGASADTILDGEDGTSTNFGSQLACGDVNGDGYADLAVDAPGSLGKVHIFHGSPLGIADRDLSTGQRSDTTIVSAEVFELGSAVKFGDVNADGYADLAIGARGYNNYQGRAYLFYGSSSGIPDSNLRAGDSPDTTLTGFAGDYGFGYRLAFGDTNGDGHNDLAVGACWNINQGYVYVFHGSPNGIQDIDLSAGGIANAEIIGINARNQFAYSLVFGDVTGDGYDDLAVGARLYSGNQGRVYLFQGSAAGILNTDLSSTSADGVLTGELLPSSFGQAAILDDFNGDGRPDIAVSGNGWNWFRGRVHVFHNSGMGIADKDLAAGDATDTTLTGEFQSSFGEALAD